MNHFIAQGGYGDPENFQNYGAFAICILIIAAFVFVVVWLVIRDRLRLRRNRDDGKRGFPLD